MHESARNPAVDIYGLHLFRLVAETGSFTRAGRLAGLTQSAITRQIQNVEARLGIPLLERTTRQVRPTAAGCFLLEQSARILGDLAHSVQRLREEFADAPKLVRVGVSRSIGLAYLPGFFTGFQRRFPQALVQVR
jgi:DNA-binding transcriptional LysR family regulator